MAKNVIGSLRVNLGLDSAQFMRGAKKIDRQVGSMKKTLNSIGGIALAAAAGLAAITKIGMRNIDAQAKLARSLNTTVASMQVMERAGNLAGVSMTGIEQATKDLTRRLSQAAGGAGPAITALDRLGLSAETLMGIPLDQRILTINAAINEFIPAAERAAVAGQLFGEEGSIAMSRIDPDTIRQAAADMAAFGVAISEVDAKQIERTNDAITRLGLIWDGVATRITIAAGPALEWVAERMAQIWKDARIVGVAISHLQAIFTESFGRMSRETLILQNSMQITWINVKVGFFGVITDIKRGWADFLHAFADGIQGVAGMEGTFTSMKDAAILAGSAVYESQLGVTALESQANGLAAQNARLAVNTSGPLTSVREMLLEVKELTDTMDVGTMSSEEFANSLGGIADAVTGSGAGGGGGAAPALETVKENVKSIAETINDSITSGFQSMIDGTKTVGAAFRDMARDIIKQLYDVLVVQETVAGFKSLISGVGGAGGLGGLIVGALDSFDGGGHTGYGPRAGGMDGKGGRLAVVHPNETVIDHTKGGSGGAVTVNQTINVTTGVQATVRSEIVSLMPQISESAKMAVLEARKRGGAYAGSF